MDIGLYLKEKITEWQTKGHKHTLLVLSNRSRVGYSTVRRIAAGDGANMQTFLQLASVIMTPEEAKEKLDLFFPEAKRSLERSFRFLPGAVQHDPIRSKKAFFALALCCPDSGIHNDELRSILGTRDADVLTELFDAEILRMDDHGIVRLSHEYFFTPDQYRVTRWIGWAAELFDHRNADQEGNMTCIRISGLNAQAVHKMSKLVTETEKALCDILADPKNHGDISQTMVLMTSINRK